MRIVWWQPKGIRGGSTPLEKISKRFRHRAEPRPILHQELAMRRKRIKPIKVLICRCYRCPSKCGGIDVGAKEHVVAVPCDRTQTGPDDLPSLYSRPSRRRGRLKRCGLKPSRWNPTGITAGSVLRSLEQYGFEIGWSMHAACKHRARPNQNRRARLPWIQSFDSFGLLVDRFA